MYFISCFDANWMQNQRWFFGHEPAPRDENGRVQYLQGANRCFGYYPTQEEALAAVRENRGDLQECLYAWCVVEHVPAGIHAYSMDAPVWFRWAPGASRREGTWEPAERPPETQQLLGFSIG